MTDEIAGWKPPTTYDVETDSIRLANQRDLDELNNLAQAYGRLVTLAREMIKINDQLIAETRAGRGRTLE